MGFALCFLAGVLAAAPLGVKDILAARSKALLLVRGVMLGGACAILVRGFVGGAASPLAPLMVCLLIAEEVFRGLVSLFIKV